MSALTFEHVLHRDQTVLCARPIGHAEVVGHMREQDNVHILESAGPNKVCFSADLLFRYTSPQL